jgi:ABC-type transport system substrate-binding protein
MGRTVVPPSEADKDFRTGPNHLTFGPPFAVIQAMRTPISAGLGVVALVTSVFMTACGPKNSTGENPNATAARSDALPPEPAAVAQDIVPGKPGGRLVIATISDPKTLNPTTANETSSTEVYRLLFAKLARFNWETQTAEPDLAYEWSVAEDGRTWTYKLRKNLFWSDGHPLTADDVVFTWNDVVFNPDIVNVTRDAFTIDGKELKVSKIDDLTVQVVTPTIFAPFVEFFGDVEILPKHALSAAVAEGRFVRQRSFPSETVQARRIYPPRTQSPLPPHRRQRPPSAIPRQHRLHGHARSQRDGLALSQWGERRARSRARIRF